MKAKCTCVCRGNGKAYFALSVHDVENSMVFEVITESKEGHFVPSQLINLETLENLKRLVVVVPVLDSRFTFTVYALNNNQKLAIYRQNVEPNKLKWISRFNYRYRPNACSEIRDIDQRVVETNAVIAASIAIPADEHETIRATLTLPQANANQATLDNLIFLDSNYEPVSFKPIFMGLSHYQKMIGDNKIDFTELQFSFKVPNNYGPYSVYYPKTEHSGLGFKVFNTMEQRDLRVLFGQQTQNAEMAPYYNNWMCTHRIDKTDIEIQKMTSLSLSPLFSIIVPLYQTPITLLNEMIDSVLLQTYGNLELILVNASPEDNALCDTVNNLSQTDDRIKVITLEKNEGISLNTACGIEQAQGDYIAFLDHDDVLEPNALFEYASAIAKDKKIDLLYCDEDKLLPNGDYAYPYFKPDFSRFLLCEINYICHFLCIRSELLRDAYVANKKYDGAQDHKMILDCLLKTSAVHHVPKILYHWRITESSTASGTGAKPYADLAGKLAISEYLQAKSISAIVHTTDDACRYSVEYIPNGRPLISILIPNKDNAEILEACVRSVEERSTYSCYEIIIIENNSVEDRTFEMYEILTKRYKNIRIVTWRDYFNYSAINNYGACNAQGDYYVLLNNDTEIITPGWMEEMLGICQDPEVGAVGAKLLYPDGTIQHAGVFVQGMGAAHLNLNLDGKAHGYHHSVLTTRELSACTAACLMVKKSVFESVGGLTEEYAVAFNDVDLCLKIRKEGYLVVYASRVELYHYESLSRGYETTVEKQIRFFKETSLMHYRWAEQFVKGDPYVNPNLKIDSCYYGL